MPAKKGNQNAAKPAGEKQEARITWKLRQSEKNQLVKQAQSEGLKLTAWLRKQTGLGPDS